MPFPLKKIVRVLRKLSKKLQPPAEIKQKPTKRTCSLRLPPELLEQIVLYLKPKYYIPPLDLLAFSLVCTEWNCAARRLLSDDIFNDLTLTSAYKLPFLQRAFSLLVTCQTLRLPYTTSITKISIYLSIFIPNVDDAETCRSTATEVLRILSLSPNLRTIRMFLSEPISSTRHSRELIRFLRNLETLTTKITKFDIRANYPSNALEPPLAQLISCFCPNLHTLHLDSVFRQSYIHRGLPTATSHKHFSFDSKIGQSLQVALPFVFLPDPIHCSIQGMWTPTDFAFVLDQQQDPDPRPNHIRNADNTGIVTIRHRRVRCRRLRSLSVDGDLLDDSFLLDLAHNARELERLVLRPFFPNIADQWTRWEYMRWTSVRLLDLGACSVVDPASLEVMLNACPNMQEVRMVESQSKECRRVLVGQRFSTSDMESLTVLWRRQV